MPNDFDPRDNLEYRPPMFHDTDRYFLPDDEEVFDDFEGYPVALNDDMLMRAHYLDLALERIRRKEHPSDKDLIEKARIETELKPLLRHIWSVGSRALKYWVQGHLRGGSPQYKDLNIDNLRELVAELRQLDMPPEPALDILKPLLQYGYGDDWDDEIRRYTIGAPLLYGQEAYDEYDEEQFQEALERAGISSLDEVEPSKEDVWWFLESLLQTADIGEAEVSGFGIDTNTPQQFLDGEDDPMYLDFMNFEFPSYNQGYIDEDIYTPREDAPHVEPFADIRTHPKYESHLDDLMADRWDPINDMHSNRRLLSEMDISEEEWNALDLQTQMSLISRLMQAQHRTGNVITDYTPNFEFSSDRYEPQGDWKGWMMGEAPSVNSNTLRMVLDDLNASEMVGDWDRFFEEHPGHRWAHITHPMTKLASALDAKGHPDLADRMDRMALPYHATPDAERLIEEGYTTGIPDYAWEAHFDLLYQHLPEESQQRIEMIVEENDPTMHEWGLDYWANVPEAVDALVEEYQHLFPNSQMIWSNDWPSEEQLQSYGPEMVHFDEQDLDFLGHTFDGYVHIHHPQEGETGIPGDLFRKVDPHDLMERGWDPDA